MKRVLALLALFLSATVARGETALSVDMNALWRVDLNSHEAQLISELGTTNPRFSCSGLAVSRTGLIRCERGGQLYGIRDGSAQMIGPMPHGIDFLGISFDADGRLWAIGGHLLWQLDPSTGAVISEKWIGLKPHCYATFLAAKGNQLFTLAECDDPYPAGLHYNLEEIDPETGASLGSVDLTSLGVAMPMDGAFDSRGDLWFSRNLGGPIMGIYGVSYNRRRLSPLSLEETWIGWFSIWSGELKPSFHDIDAIEGTSVIEVPAVSPLGAFVFVLLLAVAAWFRLGAIARPR